MANSKDGNSLVDGATSTTDLRLRPGLLGPRLEPVPSRLSPRHRGMRVPRLLTSLFFYLPFSYFCDFFSLFLVDFSSSDNFGSPELETSRPSELLRLERIPSILRKPWVTCRLLSFFFFDPLDGTLFLCYA